MDYSSWKVDALLQLVVVIVLFFAFVSFCKRSGWWSRWCWKFSFARDLVGDSNVTSWRQISRLQAANYSRLKVTPRCHSYLVKSVNSIMTVRWRSNYDLPNKLIKWKTHSSSWNTTIVNCRREGYWIFIFPHDCSVLLPCLSFALQYNIFRTSVWLAMVRNPQSSRFLSTTLKL